MDLGVMVNIYEETEFTGAFEDAVEAGFKHGQVNVFLPRITPEEVRLLALAAKQANFTVDAVGCYFNPLRPDDSSLHHVDYTDWKTVAANMAMMNGVERIVCWSGTLGKTLTTPNLLNQEEDTFNSVVAAIKGMLDEVKGLRAEILVEPFTAHVLCDGKTCSRLTSKFPGGEVKIVLDAPNIISHKEFVHRDQRVQEFVAEVGPTVGIVHLKGMARDDNGHRRFPRAGAGVLDYAAYLRAIADHTPEVPVIIDHVYSVREMIAARQFVESVVKDAGI
jgi:sugar phosphate isomerase/epimerase